MAVDRKTSSPGTPPPTGVEDWMPGKSGWARQIERFVLWFEQPINRLSRTTQLNPFYHTGPIAVFLLGVVAVTGFFLYIFFQYGYEASYMAAARLEGQPIGRMMRALHRYASVALVITTFFHAVRTLFQERFRGPRWLAWVSGHVMMAFIWGAGLTGYWLLWDTRAQFLNRQIVALLNEWFPQTGANFANWLIAAETGESWVFFALIFVAHFLLFAIVAGIFFIHIQRLKEARFLPEIPWVIGMTVVLVVGSLIFPVGMLPAADVTSWSQEVSFDPVFLFFLPTNGIWGWVIWVTILVIGVALTFMPWISRGDGPLPTVKIIDEACTGCTRCAVDCPYNAIEMQELPEDAEHKFLAIANPDLCTSCGICIGSCLDDAITLGETDPRALWDGVKQRIEFAKARAGEAQDIEVVLTCSRFAHQGALPYLERRVEQVQATHDTIEVIAVPCAGAVPPDLLVDALEHHGAAEVRLVGCPPSDCTNRTGNLIAEQRLTRERAPRLRRKYANVPISAVWLPPNQFDAALAEDVHAEESNWLETRRLLQSLSWQNFLPAIAMLSFVLLIQILLGDLSFTPAVAEQATVEIAIPNVKSAIGSRPSFVGPTDLVLEINGESETLMTLTAEELLAIEPQSVYFERQLPLGSDQAIELRLENAYGVYEIGDLSVDGEAGAVFRVKDQTGRRESCRSGGCAR